MNYEGQICRAPMERSAYMLPVSVGCRYNCCRFCSLFKHLQFRDLPLEQIETELRRVQALGALPRRVFLGDGSAFSLPFDRLMEILSLIHQHLPSVQEIRMDATVSSVLQRSDHELKELTACGVDCLYLGIESGLEDVLAFMEKDHNLEEAYRAAERLHGAGLSYGAHIMTGVAGAGRSLENAEATASFLRKTRPQSVTNFSLFLPTELPLYQDILAGRFQPASELDNLREARQLLLKLMDSPVPRLRLDSMHDAVAVRVRGDLPKDGSVMLKAFDQAISAHPDWCREYAWV